MKTIYQILPDGKWLLSGQYKNPQIFCAKASGMLIDARVNDGIGMTLENAEMMADYANGMLDIGYLLTGNGIVCIDIDVKNSANEDDESLWTSAEVLAYQKSLLSKFAAAGAYIEYSRSGQGYHIWVKCAESLLPLLNRRSRQWGVEIYADKRYIVCTGKRICGGDELVDASMLVWETLGELGMQSRDPEPGQNVVTVGQGIHTALPAVVTADGALTDMQLIETGLAASNGDKFRALCRGEWRELNYPSQSEADLSLMSMLAFYSRDDVQCIRVFRMTELGKREKAQRTDYLARTLRSIRRRQYRENQAMEIALQVDPQVDAKGDHTESVADAEDAAVLSEVRALTGVAAGDTRPVDRITGRAGDVSALDTADNQWMVPGRMGRLVNWILSASYLPVYEIAESAAIGLAAGICGRAWNIPGSGLNMYILLVAKSAIGKEALHTSISKIQSAVMKHNPGIANFISFDEHASGQGLLRAVAERPSHVAVMGEFGRRLKVITTRDDGPLATYRTYLTNLYQKSAQGSTAGGLRYSDNEKNVTINGAVAFSLVGETTPGTFYESLDTTIMEDGFLSRFLTISYDGDRPVKNDNMVNDLSPELLEYIAQLSIHAAKLNSINQVIMVGFDEPAANLLQTFDLKCDGEIRKTDDEAYRQAWNRAALKARRLTALCAVMENYISPKGTLEMAQWAIGLVQKDIDNFMTKLESGDIGNDDSTRVNSIIAAIRDYIYGGDRYRSINGRAMVMNTENKLRKNGVVTEAAIKYRCRNKSAFKSQRGANFEIECALENLVKTGVLFKLTETVTMREFSTSGVCYKIIQPEIFKK
jgi:hypothetical protein|nr:MAG TPA: hypothetical protein [Caudoviricetes sp.]